ncbi:hypothetical protein JWG41_18160 [Leptospira sp. 201903075]|uniref:hypothetical protein n=1 Tax=Leptospira chreensis TaxID=2810035 RepID=UPI0019633336|nr:hypothetical protein [Leptospira chreensis]MBM9592373.1 hypothetical protein [Leptospira chreensis]
MKLIYLLVLLGIFLNSCSEKEISLEINPEEEKKQRIVIDKKLGEATYFKEFLSTIKNKDCITLLNYFDDTVNFSFGERQNGTFQRSTSFLEVKYLFSACDLFFDSTEMRRRLSFLGGNSLSNLHFSSPLDMLEKSLEIRFLATEGENKESEVDLALIGGLIQRPETHSRKVDFKFRCPDGFLRKCYMYTFTFY